MSNEVQKGRAGKARPFAQQSPRHVIWENVKGFAIVIAVFLAFRAFIAEAYRIPSGSMIPTLLVGDWLFVNKMTYGAHIPFTDSRLPGYRTPTKGDVVVFVSPYQADNGDDRQLDQEGTRGTGSGGGHLAGTMPGRLRPRQGRSRPGSILVCHCESSRVAGRRSNPAVSTSSRSRAGRGTGSPRRASRTSR